MGSKWTRRDFGRVAAMAGAAAISSRWMRGEQNDAGQGADVSGANSLRAHAEARGLLYGAAVVPQMLNADGVGGDPSQNAYSELVKTQTNMLVAENAMKWGPLRPSPGVFDFTQADKMMRFAAMAGQKVRGHNLCWHNQNPGWLKTTANKDNARALLVEHIETVAAHFRGQLHSWDVVNEAIEPKDGQPDGLRKTIWYELIGPEYLEVAFRTAAAVDPEAKLTYNDYSIELDTPEQAEKRERVMALVRGFQAKGVPIHAIGLQSHLQADGAQPGAGLVKFIRELGKMGLEVYVTEMDVNTRKIAGGAAEQDAAVAKVYRDYPALVLAEPNVKAVLTWGITDAHTWLNSRQPWAQRPDGAKQRPLPFDDDLKPTAAFFALREAMDGVAKRKA